MDQVSYEGADLQVLTELQNYYDWIMETFAPYVAGNVVEYGGGLGTVSARLLPYVKQLTIVEPSSNLISFLQSRFSREPKVLIVGESLEMHAAHLDDGSLDTIVMVNVLEHVENDLQALYHLIRSLKSGGHLLIFVPALQQLMSELDRIHGHYRRYHKNDLIGKVSAAGGTILVCRYFDFFGIAPWLILNKLLRSTAFNPTLVRLQDKIVVPLCRRFERIVSPPVGKNLILVATKC
jgi:SAM-dependent methyltransferase